MLAIAYDSIYRLPLPERHRFPMEKYELLPRQLLHEGLCQEADFHAPEKASYEIVCAVHDSDYVDRLLNKELDAKEVRAIGFPLTTQLIEREFIIAGGTIWGCHQALEKGIAFNIAGGTHHAFKAHGEAFCLLNDQAIAAQYLLDTQLAKQILIVDLDVHQGNGTAEIFSQEPSVFTFSMHGAKNYPFRKEQSDLDIEMEDNCSDSTFLTVLEKKLPELIDSIQPDFVFYLSGVDVLATDKLGRLGMSLAGCKERDRLLLALCASRNIPVQCSMGGGYSESIKTIIEAHANTYRVGYELFT